MGRVSGTLGSLGRPTGDPRNVAARPQNPTQWPLSCSWNRSAQAVVVCWTDLGPSDALLSFRPSPETVSRGVALGATRKNWVAVGNWGVALTKTRRKNWVTVGNLGVALGATRKNWVAVGNRGVALGATRKNWVAVGNRGVALGATRKNWVAVGNRVWHWGPHVRTGWQWVTGVWHWGPHVRTEWQWATGVALGARREGWVGCQT